MERSKLVAIITGAISIILAIVYLIIVQFLDFRGEMQPAPQSQLLQPSVVASTSPHLPITPSPPLPLIGDNFQARIFRQ